MGLSVKRLLDRFDPNRAYTSGILTGLLSATFSTFVISLGARRIGRSTATDWMEVGTIFRRDANIRKDPGLLEILTGIAVHQWADISWATLFFGSFLNRLPQRRQRKTILISALPWAVATSAIEYWLIIPWLQPLVTMQVPYWTALTVHITSSAAYPLYFLVREKLHEGNPRDGDVAFARATAGVLGVGLGFLALLALIARTRREEPGVLGDEKRRQATMTFLRKMTWHHEVGLRMAHAAAERGVREKTRMLGRLMVAGHKTELDVMHHWWESWAEEPMAPLTPDEYEQMAGMPDPADVEELEQLQGMDFERKFLELMIFHHQGAIKMADDLWTTKGDPRVLLLADSIRHAQGNQIEFMREL